MIAAPLRRWLDRNKEVEPPRLSVVVPAHQVEEYLAECLDSILAARWPLEVIVVDDGSTDGTRRIAAKYAKRDPRVTLISQTNAGLSAARNVGVREATAPYLMFVDSDDLVDAAALRGVIDQLDASGSDLALVEYTQIKGGVRQEVAPWIRAIHEPGRRTTRFADELVLAAQTTAWSKVHRRSFWDEAELSFREGALFEDQDSTAAAFVAASNIDVVPGVAYLYRVRSGSIMRRGDPAAVTEFFDAIARALDTYRQVPGARATRASQVLTNDVPRMLRALERVEDPAYRAVLLERVAGLLDEPGLDLTEAPAEARVAYALIRAGRSDDVASFVEQGGFQLADHPFAMTDLGPVLRLPFWDDPDVPREAFVLSERQTPLDAVVLRANIDKYGLWITVAAWIRHLDGGDDLTCRAWFVDEEDWDASGGDGGGDNTEREFTVTPSTEVIGHRLRTTRSSNERSVWELELLNVLDVLHGVVRIEVSHRGRVRQSIVTRIDPEGSAAVPQSFAGVLLPGEEPFIVRRGEAHRWEGDLTDPAAIPIPEEIGEHEVPGTVDQSLALQLPWDFDRADRRGYLALAGEQRLKIVVLPNTPLEQQTFWYRRDHVADPQSSEPT